MKIKVIAFALVALICWAFPLTVWAKTAPTQEEAIFINYEQFHKVTTPTNAPEQSNTISNKPVPLTQKKDSVPSSPSHSGRYYSKEEVIQLIKDYSAQYGISAELPLRIANCESGYNQFSRNSHSTASGVFQFLNSTWANQPAGKRGVSVFDADANVQAAVWLLAHGKNSMWVCK